MKITALLLSCVLTVTSAISYAQNSILAGKIVDENNKSIPGAKIRITKVGDIINEMIADNDGLYSSKMLEEGAYHIDVVTNEKHFKAKKLLLDATAGSKTFYIIQVAGEKVRINKVDEDPSLKMKLSRVESRNFRNQSIFDNKYDGLIFIKTDTATGKVISVQASGRKAPRME